MTIFVKRALPTECSWGDLLLISWEGWLGNFRTRLKEAFVGGPPPTETLVQDQIDLILLNNPVPVFGFLNLRVDLSCVREPWGYVVGEVCVHPLEFMTPGIERYRNAQGQWPPAPSFEGWNDDPYEEV